MKKRLMRSIRKLLAFMKANLTTVSPRGSGLGVYLRTHLKGFNLRQAIGVNLAGMAFFAGIVIPQSQEALSGLEVVRETQETVIVADTSASVFQWPLGQFGLSQRYSGYHPGLDLTAPIGTPIYPIGDGVVEWTQSISFGYGRHMLISHPNGIRSLYAHLSTITVRDGQTVTKSTKIGNVGITGWSTGSHLHFEVYQESLPINPLEVLPAIK